MPANVEEHPAAQSDATSAQRALYGGFGTALGTAFELAAIPILFALFGRWLDGRFGTTPLLMLVFAVFAIVALGARSYYTYKTKMEEEEARRPMWKR